mmetsp:Transcript_53446/g.106361  ORF Transcript_53446/g.106361 Transcript_53446/m.106361 type:complete len:249 (+) Transcript_53446:58-804(+)
MPVMGTSSCTQAFVDGQSLCTVDVHDGCTLPLEDVLPGAFGSRVAHNGRGLHVGIDDVWSALDTDSHWYVDKAAEIWQTFEERDPCLADTLNLSIVAEKFDSLPGIQWHYLVKVFLGNDEHGRASFSSHKCTEWPPKTYPQLNFSGNNFMLKLIPVQINALGRRLLSTLMEVIPGTQEEDPTTQEFHLCGQLASKHMKHINGRLELRVSWLQDGVMQYLLVPFIPAQDMTMQNPHSRHSMRSKSRKHA